MYVTRHVFRETRARDTISMRHRGKLIGCRCFAPENRKEKERTALELFLQFITLNLKVTYTETFINKTFINKL